MLYYNLDEFYKNEHTINEQRKIILDEYFAIYDKIEQSELSLEKRSILEKRLHELEKCACELGIFAFDANDILDAVIKTQKIDPSCLRISAKINGFLGKNEPKDVQDFIKITKQIGYFEHGINSTLCVMQDDELLFSVDSCIKNQDFEELYNKIFFRPTGLCGYEHLFFNDQGKARFYLISETDYPNFDSESKIIREVLKYLVYERVYLPNMVITIEDNQYVKKTQNGSTNKQIDDEKIPLDIEIQKGEE